MSLRACIEPAPLEILSKGRSSHELRFLLWKAVENALPGRRGSRHGAGLPNIWGTWGQMDRVHSIRLPRVRSHCRSPGGAAFVSPGRKSWVGQGIRNKVPEGRQMQWTLLLASKYCIYIIVITKADGERSIYAQGV